MRKKQGKAYCYCTKKRATIDIFILELASSFIQRFVYRHFGGKRFFLMAPIHHHFEKQGIPDSRIIIRFWIAAILCALIGIATLKIR